MVEDKGNPVSGRFSAASSINASPEKFTQNWNDDWKEDKSQNSPTPENQFFSNKEYLKFRCV